jgi:hypothetical protein
MARKPAPQLITAEQERLIAQMIARMSLRA